MNQKTGSRFLSEHKTIKAVWNIFSDGLYGFVFSDGLRRYPLPYPLFDSFGTQAQIVQKFFRVAVFGYSIGNAQKQDGFADAVFR